MVLAVGLGPDPGFPSAFDTGALVPGCGHFYPWGIRKGLRRKACFSSVNRGTRGPSGARLVVFTGIGASNEDILQVPLGRLVPEVPLSRGHLAVIHLFAGPAARRGAVFGRLLAPLADVFCEVERELGLHLVPN
jgi:hypothetical protein